MCPKACNENKVKGAGGDGSRLNNGLFHLWCIEVDKKAFSDQILKASPRLY